MSREDPQPMARRKFLTAATSAATSLALAGCSDSGSNPSENDETTPETDQQTTGAEQQTDETDQQASDTTEPGQQETNGEPEPEQQYEIESRIKNAASEAWIQFPLDAIQLSEYNPDQTLEERDEIGIYGENERTGAEGLMDYLTNNVVADIEDVHSIILIYEDEIDIPAGIDQDRAEEYVSDKDSLTGWPVIPEYGGDEYPQPETFLFEEEAVEHVLQENVSGVRDVSEDFPDELLEYAEQ